MIDTNTQGSNTLGETERSYRRLWLIRHGITAWNSEQRYCGHSDIPLSSEGHIQARWLACLLRTQHIARIYSSDLLRARQTADAIATQSLQPIQIAYSSAWRELAFGLWEGLTYEQIIQQDTYQPAFFTDPMHASPPGGESLPALAQRIQQAFSTLAQKWADPLAPTGDIVLVSHGGPLRVLLCNILGMSLEHQWQLRFDPGSLSAIDFLPTPLEKFPMATLALLNVQRRTRPQSISSSLPLKIPSADALNHISGYYAGGTTDHV